MAGTVLKGADSLLMPDKLADWIPRDNKESDIDMEHKVSTNTALKDQPNTRRLPLVQTMI